MSMEPQSWPEPAAEVARAVRAKHYGRQAPLPVAVRDRFGELFADAEFASAFGATGPRGWSPGRLALVTVLQMAENLTDRQAAEAVRDRLSWAYALGLDLGDTGFDHTVLCEFRRRVLSRQLHDQVPDLLACTGTTHPNRVCPLSFQQAAMPRQQGARRDEPMSAQPRRQ
jgi:hypothetical protein